MYYEFNSYRSNPITKFARDAQGNVYTVDEDSAPEIMDSINTVWRKYKKKTGIELSQITHKPNTAWSKAYANNETSLDVDDILDEHVW